jgi:hypothetical protein
MIPKSKAHQASAAQRAQDAEYLESALDQRITEKMYPVWVNITGLCPEAVKATAQRYRDGGWHVEVQHVPDTSWICLT